MAKSIIVNKLSDNGYPTSSRNYKTAHSEADNAEKKKYPSGYNKLKHAEKKLGKHELMGKNTKSGKIEVEKKYKNYKEEISYHERKEHYALKKLSKDLNKRK
jgi:hypothetical protein